MQNIRSFSPFLAYRRQQRRLIAIVRIVPTPIYNTTIIKLSEPHTWKMGKSICVHAAWFFRWFKLTYFVISIMVCLRIHPAYSFSITKRYNGIYFGTLSKTISSHIKEQRKRMTERRTEKSIHAFTSQVHAVKTNQRHIWWWQQEEQAKKKNTQQQIIARIYFWFKFGEKKQNVQEHSAHTHTDTLSFTRQNH